MSCANVTAAVFGWALLLALLIGCAHPAPAQLQAQAGAAAGAQGNATAGTNEETSGQSTTGAAVVVRRGARHFGARVVPAADGGLPEVVLTLDDAPDEYAAASFGAVDAGSSGTAGAQGAADAGAQGAADAGASVPLPAPPSSSRLRWWLAGLALGAVGLIVAGIARPGLIRAAISFVVGAVRRLFS